MTERLRIAVADDEPEMRDYLQETLSILGHDVVCAAATGTDLVTQCRRQRPDLIVADIKMPDMDGIDAAAAVCQERAVPVILVSAYHERELIDRALTGAVLAYLVKPIKQADLETAIAIARRRFRELDALQRQASDLRQALEDRKFIERAKGILMKHSGLDEQAAFRRMQKLSSEKNTKMAEIARMIVTANEALEPSA